MTGSKKYYFHRIEVDINKHIKMGVMNNQYYITSLNEQFTIDSTLKELTFRILFDMANNINEYIPKEYQNDYCLLTPNQVYFHSKDVNRMEQFKQKNNKQKFYEYYSRSCKEPEYNGKFITKSKLQYKNMRINSEDDTVSIYFTILNEIVVLSFPLDNIHKELEHYGLSGLNNIMLIRTLDLLMD